MITETSPNPWGSFLRDAASKIVDTASTLAISKQNAKEAESMATTAKEPPPMQEAVKPTATIAKAPFPWEKLAIGLGAVAAAVAILQGLKALRKGSK